MLYKQYHILPIDDDIYNQEWSEYEEYSYTSRSFEELNTAFFSDILDVDSDSKAIAFVRKSLNYISKPELFKHIYRLTNRELKAHKQNLRDYYRSSRYISKQSGGNIEILPNDQIIYRFLAIIDTIHDFQKDKYNIKRYLEEYYNKNLEYIPDCIEFDLIKNEEKLISHLATNPILVFSKQNITIENPFYGIEINTYMPITQNGNMKYSYEQLVANNINYVSNRYRQRFNSYSVDLFSSSLNNKSRIEYKQLYSLIGYINNEFGPSIDFQIDGTSNPFIRLICSMSLIYNATQKLFTTDQECIDFLKANQYDIDDNQVEKIWFTSCSDSNLFDAADSDDFRYIDKRPTGSIYDSIVFPYNIFLNGVIREIPPKAYNVVYLEGQHHKFTEVVVKYNNVEMLSVPVNNDVGSVISSAPNIAKYIRGARVVLNDNVNHNLEDIVEEVISNYDRELLYALKRGGDWGQVEHAKKYGKVFVTNDRYAALYAYWRKVPTILIRNSVVIKQYLLDVDIEKYPDISQYSFIILNPANKN